MGAAPNTRSAIHTYFKNFTIASGLLRKVMMQHLFTCLSCGYPCQKRTVSVNLPRSGGGIAVFRNVTAEVCTKCGEMHFTLLTTSRMIAIVQGFSPPDDMELVPVYDMQRASG